MKRYEVIHLVCRSINKKHKEIFGWIGKNAVSKSNYEIGTEYAPYDIESLQRKQKQLRKTVRFYGWLTRNAENLANIGIIIKPHKPVNEESILENQTIYFRASEKEGIIWFLYGPEKHQPVLMQIKSLIEEANDEISQIEKKLKELNEEVPDHQKQILKELFGKQTKTKQKEAKR